MRDRLPLRGCAALAALLLLLAPVAARAGGPFPVGQPFSLSFPFPDLLSCTYEIVNLRVLPPIATPLAPPQFVTGAAPQTFSIDFMAESPGTGIASLALIGDTGCSASGSSVVASFEIGEGKTPPPDQVLVIDPAEVTLRRLEPRTFRALIGPVDEDGNPDFGPDGIPGNADDAFDLVSVTWSVEGGVGMVAPQTGPTTTFTPSPASDSGYVVATLGAMTARAFVFLDTPGDGAFFGLFDPRWNPAYTFSLLPDTAADPADFSRTLFAPDSGSMQTASLRSFDAGANLLDELAVTLEPDGSGMSLSLPIVAVRAGGPIPGGPSGGYLFVEADAGGGLSFQLPPFEPLDAPVAGARTHEINLEVERMLRHGLPLADDAPAGATQIVVRLTTLRELIQSLDRITVGAPVLPLDASGLLLGEVPDETRTIAALEPADLPGLRQQILDDVAQGRGDPGDPRDVERFLRRNRDRGRVVVTLDAPLERVLATRGGAYLGALGAGMLDYREDLLLREAQRELRLPGRGGERRAAITVNLIESPEVTNVLPYDDFMAARERSRLRREPSRGGVFQNAGQPGFGQLVIAAGGTGHRRYPIGTIAGSSAFLYTANAGEDMPASAFGLAHLVGHLLFGGRHDTSDPLSILQPAPPSDPGFYVSGFAAFHYTEATLRRGGSQLDRRWSQTR
jgi:hypothetical protein